MDDVYTNIINNVIVPLIITIAPIFILKWKNGIKKDNKNGFLIAICWGILAIFISFILVSLIKEKFILELVIAIICGGSLFNYFILKDYFDIKKIPLGILIFISFFFITVLELIVATLLNINISTIDIKTEILLQTIIEILFIGCYILIFKKMFTKMFKDFKKNFNKYLDIGFKYWFLGIAIMIVSNLLIIFITSKTVSNNENAVQSIIKEVPLLALLSTGIIGPFVEEICFRFSFKKFIKDKWLFCIISGLVFGLLHIIFANPTLVDFLYVIPYGSLGFFFALMYYETDNIFTNIMMHTFHNFVLTSFSIITSILMVVI